MIKKILSITSLLLLWGCVSPEQVRDNVLKELEVKYSRKFMTGSINMNRDEGNWGSANLIVYPADDESLKFRVNYSYSDMKLTWEDYKGELWNRELSIFTATILGIPPSDVKADITSKNSIAFDSMSLPYRLRFAEVIREINRPGIGLQVKIKSGDFLKSAVKLSDASEALLNFGFEKVTVKAELLSESDVSDVLKFKVTKKDHSPSAGDLKNLFSSIEAVTLKEAGDLYNTASAYRSNGENDKAVSLYLDIIRRFDNRFRHEPYVLLESHYVIESAFAAAELLRDQGKTGEAIRFYRLVTDRLEYKEVKGELYEIHRIAKERLQPE